MKKAITNSVRKGVDEEATRMINAGMSKKEAQKALSDQHGKKIRIIHIKEEPHIGQ